MKKCKTFIFLWGLGKLLQYHFIKTPHFMDFSPNYYSPYTKAQKSTQLSNEWQTQTYKIWHWIFRMTSQALNVDFSSAFIACCFKTTFGEASLANVLYFCTMNKMIFTCWYCYIKGRLGQSEVKIIDITSSLANQNTWISCNKKVFVAYLILPWVKKYFR